MLKRLKKYRSNVTKNIIKKLLMLFKRNKVIIVIAVVIAWIYYAWPTYYPDDISCYYEESFDDLVAIENHRVTSKNNTNHIYFHETSCRGYLDPRQACVVESAARIHPEWQINVVFSAPMNMSTRNNLNQFQEFGNVKFWRVNILEYVSHTPLEDIVRDWQLNNSYWTISHASELLRFATLYKFDGVYLDLDMLLVKRLDGLTKNFAAREYNPHFVSEGILSFSSDTIGRAMATDTINELARSFRGPVLNNNGPGTLTRVLTKRCNNTDTSRMTKTTCAGFEVYGPLYFYYTPWHEGHKLFSKKFSGEILNDFSFGYHFWNSFTKHLKVEQNSAMAQLARNYCPLFTDYYQEKLGSNKIKGEENDNYNLLLY